MSEIDYEVDSSEGKIALRFAGHSDRGVIRRVNEDSFFAAMPLFLVADGMGGHAFGDRASRAAVAAFASTFDHSPASPRAVLDTIRAANDAVLAISENSDTPGAISGTTLAGLVLVTVGPGEGYHWMAFNIGDSRIYSWDGRSLIQVSVDHSAVQELVELGEITRAEAARHPDRNIVTRALGADLEADADIWLLPLRGRQTFILCSDGLTKELSDDEIAQIVVLHRAQERRASDGLPMTLCERLVNAAVEAGGSDNVTVVVVESDLMGSGSGAATEETLDRKAMPAFLEETRPRG